MSAELDRKSVAERIVAVHGVGVRTLARLLTTSTRMIDRLVLEPDSVAAETYRRILPRLEDLERKIEAHKINGARRSEGFTAELLALLESHAREICGEP